MDRTASVGGAYSAVGRVPAGWPCICTQALDTPPITYGSQVAFEAYNRAPVDLDISGQPCGLAAIFLHSYDDSTRERQ